MTYKEVKERFLEGEQIKVFFGIREITYSIDNKRITYKQYNKIREEFEDKYDHVIKTGGFTEHSITYKNNTDE